MSEVQIAIIDQENTQIALAVPGVQGPAGAISSGGSANQVFYKVSGTNYDAGWTFIGNANVDAAAAIAGTKISPNFGSQTVATTGVFSHALGSQGAPTITFTGDTNTGIYSPGADQVAISTGGSGRLFVDADGNVGIADSTPQRDVGTTSLSIGNGSKSTSVDLYGTVKNYAIYNGGSGQLGVFDLSASTERITLTSAGLVGIGTTDVGSYSTYGNKLVIYGTGTDGPGMTIATGTSDTGSIYFADGTTGNEIARGAVQYTHASDALLFQTAATERFRCDSSGRLLVGTPSSLDVNAGLQIAVNSSFSDFYPLQVFHFDSTDDTQGPTTIFTRSKSDTIGNISAVNVNDGLGTILFRGAGTSSYVNGALIKAEVDTGTVSNTSFPSRLVFSTTADGGSSPTERMRIPSSGGLLINATSRIDSGLTTIGFDGAAQKGLVVNDTNPANTRQFIAFDINGTTQIGYIGNSNNTGVTYSTTSDYRLKENVTPVTDGIIRLQQLKPSRFNFIADPDRTVDGFIAHEAQAVVPECVTGEKDAVDEDGNPIYQGIDQSKLVPLLTAALQEAITKIESLEARLTAAGI